MDKEQVIKKLTRYKELLSHHFDFEELILFGSFAKDTYCDDSDIDVAIVVNTFEGNYFDRIPLLWKLRRQIDNRIEPILIERDNDNGRFLDEIKKYGIVI